MAPSKLTGDTSGSCSQSDNGYSTALSFLNSGKAVEEQTPVEGIDDHLVAFSEAMKTVEKALRRAAEGKATAQAEAAEWKRKYELQRERNLQLEHKGIPPSGSEVREKLRSWTQIFLDNEMKMIRFMLPCLVCWEFRDEESRRIFQEKSLPESNGDCDDARTNNVASQSIPIHEAKEKTDKCCGRHGICSHEVLRNGETDSDLQVAPKKLMNKASFKLSWWCKGEQSDQHQHDIISFDRGNITTAERSSKQIALRWESQPQTVLILTKPNSSPVRILCAQMIRWLNDRNLDIYVEPRVRGELLEESPYFNFVQTWKDDKGFQQLHKKVDLVVTLGGDGTVLWAASMFKGPVPPLVPFSLGSLGFMTPFQSDNYEDSLNSILRGPFNITLRHRLQCKIVRGGAKTEVETEEPKLVLNEVTIDRGISSFLTNLVCSCDGSFVTRVQGDGLIISTTSGSTAYSLAAGGSMVHPQVPGILFTPICPHSLSFRPLILPEHVTLKVEVPSDSRSDAWVSFDGKDRRQLSAGDVLECSMAKWPVPTACPEDSTSTDDFLRSIHEGLHWNLRRAQAADGPRDA